MDPTAPVYVAIISGVTAIVLFLAQMLANRPRDQISEAAELRAEQWKIIEHEQRERQELNRRFDSLTSDYQKAVSLNEDMKKEIESLINKLSNTEKELTKAKDSADLANAKADLLQDQLDRYIGLNPGRQPRDPL